MTTIFNDEPFLDHFDYKKAMEDGHSYNQMVAARLNSMGIKCHAPDLYLIKSLTEIKDMTLNEKDVILDEIDGHIEVKSMNRDFTSHPDSFPFRRIIVDTVESYDAKPVKPLAYVIVSQISKEMIVIPVSTAFTWEQEDKWDYNRGFICNFYFVNKDRARRFEDLVEYLKSITPGY